MEGLDALSGLTARLASISRLDELVEVVLQEIVALGFAGVWLAILDERTGILSTFKDMIDGLDSTNRVPPLSVRDLWLPIGVAFEERRWVNITDPGALHIVEQPGQPVPPNTLALPRVIYDHLLGHPFACAPLMGSHGRPVGAIGLSSYRGKQPIPTAVLTQGPVRVFTDQLGIALERVLQLARLEDNLRKAQATVAADARVKAVGELAASVAHDINHLAAIALLAVGVGARTPDAAFGVMPQIERANRAIRDLVARLQRATRQASSETEPTTVAEVIDDILVMMKQVILEAHVTVDASLAAVPPVRCDRVLIHRAVFNLLLNARDALAAVPPDRRRIEIRTRLDDDLVRVTIADTGPGIAPDMLGRLFQPFHTTKGDDHLGLGLAGVHAALAPFGARLEAHNAPGGGAVFEIVLPAAAGAAPVAQPPPPVPSPPPVAAPSPVEPDRRIPILAVDDDPDVVYIIRAYLEPLGYEVSTATTAAHALDAAGSHDFALILCDIGMPGQSGLDMSRELRARGYRGKLVLMTGWDSQAISTDPRLAESDALLKKPFVGTELIDAIRALLAPT